MNKVGLIKRDPESQFSNKIENNTSMMDIKNEINDDTNFPFDEGLENNIKLEYDNVFETHIKNETITPKVKPDLCLDDEECDTEENFPPIKIEEVILKTENFDDTGSCSGNEIQDDVVTKQNNNSEKIYSCEYCDYKTPVTCQLKYHKMAKHDNTIKKYCCDQCDYRSRRKCHLKNHVMIKHCSENNKTYDCQLCVFKTCYKNSLKSHIMIIHDKNAVKKYCCQFCDYKSYQKRHLECHMGSKHDKNFVKKYGCDYCEYRNNDRNKLKRHVWMNHDENRPKRYGCDLCKYKADFKTELKRHLLNEHKIVWKPIL